jgi:hypothetical protein
VAELPLLSAFLYADGWDAGGGSRALSLNCDRTEHNNTKFRSGGWTTYALGARTAELGFNGFWTETVDSEAWTNLGVQRVYTAGPDETEGGVAHLLLGRHFAYQPFPGDYDTLVPFTLAVKPTDGQQGVVRGRLFKEMANVSSTGATGTAIQLGAVSASQYLYATFHVFTAGTTITAVLESDDANTFASATTRATFGPITTVGGTWATRVAGSITDTWYRLRVTACTGTFSIACAAGIQ